MADRGQPLFSLMICLAPEALDSVLVVGGGATGARKVRTLLDARMKVHLVSPHVVPELGALAGKGLILWESRRAERGDFAGRAFAVIALSRSGTEGVLPLAQGTGCLLDCCGAPELGHWSLAAQFRSGPFTIGVASGGDDPGGSARFRDELRSCLIKKREDTGL